MFTIKLCGYTETSPLKVEIEGCPADGLAAIDFRRMHGIPERPENRIDLEPLIFTNEAYARTLPVNGQADFEVNKFCQSYCTEKGSRITVSTPVVDPVAIAAYVKLPSEQAAKAVIDSILAIDGRERAKVEEKEKAAIQEKNRKEEELAKAKTLLGDEITKLTESLNNVRKQRDLLAEFISRRNWQRNSSTTA